jgi:hypothetical protein
VAARLLAYNLWVRVFNIEFVFLFSFAFKRDESNRAFIRPNRFSVKNFFLGPAKKVGPTKNLMFKTCARVASPHFHPHKKSLDKSAFVTIIVTNAGPVGFP